MGKKSSNYLMLYHKLIPIKLPHIESKISDIPNHIWEPATAVWRNAWRDAGIYMNYHNQYKCKSLFKISVAMYNRE